MAKKGVNIQNEWKEEQDIAFKDLKRIITSSPVLIIPDISKEFRVHVDACKVGRGIGAVLLQKNEDNKY